MLAHQVLVRSPSHMSQPIAPENHPWKISLATHCFLSSPKHQSTKHKQINMYTYICIYCSKNHRERGCLVLEHVSMFISISVQNLSASPSWRAMGSAEWRVRCFKLWCGTRRSVPTMGASLNHWTWLRSLWMWRQVSGSLRLWLF